jgi:hypothetical protein
MGNAYGTTPRVGARPFRDDGDRGVKEAVCIDGDMVRLGLAAAGFDFGLQSDVSLPGAAGKYSFLLIRRRILGVRLLALLLVLSWKIERIYVV